MAVPASLNVAPQTTTFRFYYKLLHKETLDGQKMAFIQRQSKPSKSPIYWNVNQAHQTVSTTCFSLYRKKSEEEKEEEEEEVEEKNKYNLESSLR